MIHHGHCIDVLRSMAPSSVDAIVTDGPYGIGFMGREWDTFKPGTGATRKLMHPRESARAKIESVNPNINGRWRSPALSPSQIDYDYSIAGLRRFQEFTAEWSVEALRVLKPGGYLLSCGAPRSYHRMACGLEDGGFVIRDKFAWLFGSGFPKNLNLGNGAGTALKPAHEPIAVAWKPFKGGVRANLKRHGTGALNIDACRIPVADRSAYSANAPADRSQPNSARHGGGFKMENGSASDIGRWPANVVIDDVAAAAIDEMSGRLVSGANPSRRRAHKFDNVYEGGFTGQADCHPARGLDVGGASRFYYCAKPSRAERDFGCEDMLPSSGGRATRRKDGSAGLRNPRAGAGRNGGARNIHPTVKPVALMRWLVRLVTPPGGLVLDPFTGSGTTGMACLFEQRRFVGIERESDYVRIAARRIAAVARLLEAEASA